MLLVGLTGGIASGKSTVCDMLKARGAYVIDTDRIAREVVEPGKPGWREVVEYFGDEVLSTDGALDRKKLGKMVFNSPVKRKALESMLHPKIFAEKERKINEIRRKDDRAIIIVDVPLLIELKRQDSYDAVILVYVAPPVQVERLTSRDGSRLDEALSRIGSQLPIDEKVPYAHFVVNNGSVVEETEKEVEQIFVKLKEMESRKMPG